MNRAEGPNKMPRFTKERRKRWHHKRMRKKECDIGDKMPMNSSSKESFKNRKKGSPRSSTFVTWYHHAPMMKVTS